MEGILKVTPERLESAATEFSAAATSLGNVTSQMTSLANGLSSAWTGDAATAYRTKFTELNDDIQRMIGMINEHASDLIEMANVYKSAESANVSLAGALLDNVIE